MVKNDVLFGSPTTSSWDGFNLQRGVTGPMDSAAVRSAVDDGAVSKLALERPWQSLDAYSAHTAPCRPRHHVPAAGRSLKVAGRSRIANFNDECYLPLYAQARRDAMRMIRREPGAYVVRRVPALALSFEAPVLGSSPRHVDFYGVRTPRPSWMDSLWRPLGAGRAVHFDTRRWLHSLTGPSLDRNVSLSLLGCWLAVLARAAVAAVRALRRKPLPGATVSSPVPEAVWLVVGWTCAFVVLGGDMVELGENARFRTMLDPLVLALVVARCPALVVATVARTVAVVRRLAERVTTFVPASQ
jgi:hypothetical protein